MSRYRKAGKLAALAAGMAVIALGAVQLVNGARFDRKVRGEVETLLEGAESRDAPMDTERLTEFLPPPLRRYLFKALGPQATQLSSAHLRHEGEFRLKPDGAWLRMKGEDHFRIDEPGYVWQARLSMAPLLWFDVRDFLMDGRGGVLAKFGSSLTVADDSGPAVAQSALIRWAGEAAWFPLAFANRVVFNWVALDDRTARALVLHRGMTVKMLFHFGADDSIEKVTTEDRLLTQNGKIIRRPWTGVFRDWRRDGSGAWIPHEAVARWSFPEGEFEYARLQVKQIAYR